MPRKATGQLVLRKQGYYARYLATVDGVRDHVFRFLETRNELVAQRKLDALVAAEERGNAPTLIETFEQAALRVNAKRARTMPGAKTEASFLRTWVFPAMGMIPPTEVKLVDVMAVLEAVRDAGRSFQTIVHVRNAIAAVFKGLRGEGVDIALPVPTTEDLPEPLEEAVDTRKKAILSEAEFLAYMAYSPPLRRGAVRERQMMTLLSLAGGMRTGELHGLTWSRAKAEAQTFDAIEVIRYKSIRKKGKRGAKDPVRQRYDLGETVLPLFLRYWWLRSERPTGNALLFPVRRPKTLAANRVGERRGHTTHASGLRRDVERAFTEAKPEAGVARPGSERWVQLFEGDADRRALVFHSSRNMAAIAADKMERLKAAAKFTNHASPTMLQHYVSMGDEVDVVPVHRGMLPDAGELLSILASWCEADKVNLADVFPQVENALGKRTGPENHENEHEVSGPDDNKIEQFRVESSPFRVWELEVACSNHVAPTNDSRYLALVTTQLLPNCTACVDSRNSRSTRPFSLEHVLCRGTARGSQTFSATW